MTDGTNSLKVYQTTLLSPQNLSDYDDSADEISQLSASAVSFADEEGKHLESILTLDEWHYKNKSETRKKLKKAKLKSHTIPGSRFENFELTQASTSSNLSPKRQNTKDDSTLNQSKPTSPQRTTSYQFEEILKDVRQSFTDIQTQKTDSDTSESITDTGDSTNSETDENEAENSTCNCCIVL